MRTLIGAGLVISYFFFFSLGVSLLDMKTDFPLLQAIGFIACGGTCVVGIPILGVSWCVTG